MAYIKIKDRDGQTWHYGEISTIEIPGQDGDKVQFSIQHVLQNKRVVPSVEQQRVTYDDGYDGLSRVVIAQIPAYPQTIVLDTNGTEIYVYPIEGSFLNEISVSVEVPEYNLNDGTVTMWAPPVANGEELFVAQAYEISKNNSKLEVS